MMNDHGGTKSCCASCATGGPCAGNGPKSAIPIQEFEVAPPPMPAIGSGAEGVTLGAAGISLEVKDPEVRLDGTFRLV